MVTNLRKERRQSHKTCNQNRKSRREEGGREGREGREGRGGKVALTPVSVLKPDVLVVDRCFVDLRNFLCHQGTERVAEVVEGPCASMCLDLSRLHSLKQASLSTT